MPTHSEEYCDNTSRTCPVVGCDGCFYCCPKHMGTCWDCGCENGDTCDDCTCHYDGPSDDFLRKEERRQMGIVD